MIASAGSGYTATTQEQSALIVLTAPQVTGTPASVSIPLPRSSWWRVRCISLAADYTGGASSFLLSARVENPITVLWEARMQAALATLTWSGPVLFAIEAALSGNTAQPYASVPLPHTPVPPQSVLIIQDIMAGDPGTLTAIQVVVEEVPQRAANV